MGTVSPPAMASQGGEQQPVLSGRLAALLFLSPGDLLSLRENPASSTAGPSPRGRMWGGIIVLSHLAHEEARLGFQRGSDDSEEGAEQIRWLLTSRAHVSVHLSLLHVSVRRGDGSTDRFSSPTYELCHLSRLVSLSEPWFLQP